ncbi:hypothetical protein SAMN05421858_5120, partial [Haladaptatus litoreus]
MNYRLTKWVIEAFERNWSTDIYPGDYDASLPQLINQDDASVSEFNDRRVSYDLTDNNAITIGSANVARDPIGTEFDYRLEAIVSVRIEGAHVDEWGHIKSADEFRYLVEAAQTALNQERVWPYRNPSGNFHFHSLYLENDENNSVSHKDYYRYDFDVR